MLVDVNLLPKKLKTSSLLIGLVISFIIIWFIMLITFTYLYFSWSGDVQVAEQKREQVTEQRIALEEQLAVENSEGQKASLGEIVEYVEKLTVPTTILIDDLMTRLPEHGYLSSFSYGNGVASIQTQFESLTETSQYVTELNQSPFLVDVKVNSINTFEHDWEEENAFTIIPRYDVNYTLEVDRSKLVWELERRERE